jgi:hypothetical protein
MGFLTSLPFSLGFYSPHSRNQILLYSLYAYASTSGSLDVITDDIDVLNTRQSTSVATFSCLNGRKSKCYHFHYLAALQQKRHDTKDINTRNG